MTVDIHLIDTIIWKTFTYFFGISIPSIDCAHMYFCNSRHENQQFVIGVVEMKFIFSVVLVLLAVILDEKQMISAIGTICTSVSELCRKVSKSLSNDNKNPGSEGIELKNAVSTIILLPSFTRVFIQNILAAIKL